MLREMREGRIWGPFVLGDKLVSWCDGEGMMSADACTAAGSIVICRGRKDMR